MSSLFGMNVITSPYAEREVHKIERNPIKKRRKGYRVVKRMEPCVYMMNPSALGFMGFGGAPTAVLHPKFAAMLTGIQP